MIYGCSMADLQELEEACSRTMAEVLSSGKCPGLFTLVEQLAIFRSSKQKNYIYII